MPNEIPLSRAMWLKNRERDRLAAQVDKIQAENDRPRMTRQELREFAAQIAESMALDFEDNWALNIYFEAAARDFRSGHRGVPA